MQTITILNYELTPQQQGHKTENLTLTLATVQGARTMCIDVGHYEKRPTFNNRDWYDLCQGDAQLQSAFLRAVASAYCNELKVPFVVTPEPKKRSTLATVIASPPVPVKKGYDEDMYTLLGRLHCVPQPMTNPEIRRAADDLGFGDSISFWEIFELGVKAAERHHGIVQPLMCESQKH